MRSVDPRPPERRTRELRHSTDLQRVSSLVSGSKVGPRDAMLTDRVRRYKRPLPGTEAARRVPAGLREYGRLLLVVPVLPSARSARTGHRLSRLHSQPLFQRWSKGRSKTVRRALALLPRSRSHSPSPLCRVAPPRARLKREGETCHSVLLPDRVGPKGLSRAYRIS